MSGIGVRRLVTAHAKRDVPAITTLIPALTAFSTAAVNQRLWVFPAVHTVAMRFLRQVLFGEMPIAVRAGVAEQRLPVYRERLLRDAQEKAAQLADQQDALYDSLKEQGGS